MLILTAATQTQQPDYVALAMVLVLALVVAVMAVRKKMTATAKQPSREPDTAPAPDVRAQVPAPGSAGRVKLHDVEPKTAAMLMAIVADKTGKPLNELRFISIKEVK